MKFEYEIDESIGDIYDIKARFTCAVEPSEEEKIKFEIAENGKSVSIIANKNGWEYLAKVCVEMSLCAEKDPMTHIHRKADMTFSGDQKEDVVTFFCD